MKFLRLAELPTAAAADGDDRFTALDRMRRFERSCTLEYLVAHLAHQLGSPLNVIDGRAAMIAAGQIAGEDAARQARIIGEQATRMSQILGDSVAFCRRGRPAVAAVDLRDIVSSAVDLLGPMAAARQVTLSFEPADAREGGRVRGNEDALLVAVTSLVENGIRATPDGGTVHLRLRAEERVDEDGSSKTTHLCLDVDDDGPAIETHVFSRLFKPFTIHGVRDACGTGLFVAHAIAKDHGGWIDCVNKKEQGVRFTLGLPRGLAHAE